MKHFVLSIAAAALLMLPAAYSQQAAPGEAPRRPVRFPPKSMPTAP